MEKHSLRFAFLALILSAFLPVGLEAQDEEQPAPLQLGDFQTRGSVTAGYRFTDIKGYRPMFLQLFNLQKGFRVQDVDVFGETQKGTNPFADSFSLSTSGLGGDPFPSAQLTVTKNKVYDFRVNWRQSYYYWNQNDSAILPLGQAGLTNNHNWQTVRKIGSTDFTVHATNNLRFNFNYYRTTDSGDTFTTRVPDFFDSPGFWGSYARANPYYLLAPINDDTNRFTGGMDYTLGSWNFHYNLGYQTFTENLQLNNVASPEQSIDTGVPSTAKQPLLGLSWSQFRRSTSPVSDFSVTGNPLPKLEYRGGYIYYRYRGPANLDLSFNGIAPNSSGVLTPYAASQSARDTVSEPSHAVNQGFTYHLKDWWDVNLDYRYSRFTSESLGNFESLFSQGPALPALTTGQTNIIWRDGLSDLDLNMSFTPTSTLLIRPGIHLLKADVESITNGQIDQAITLRTKTVWPEISAYYAPSKKFSVRGDLHSFTNGASYTAITPHTQVGTRLVFRYQPTEKVTFEDAVNITTSKLIDVNFRNSIRANAAYLTYSYSPRFSVFGGFTYDSFFAEGNIVYLRGAAPFNDFLRDQELNRVWQAGVEAKPVRRFGLRVTGNFDRSTGLGQITGEPPAYGPVTWPLVTGTVYYDFPKAGRLSVDLQRSYYIEQIVTANNFSVNMLTIRWTRNF